jgi:hypothetical protein
MFDLNYHFKFIILDVINGQLTDGGGGLAFVINDPDLHLEFVLKMIVLGPKGNALRIDIQKKIEKEIRVGMMIGKKSPHLVLYSEIFEWGDYFCIKMEYCKMGDLQNQLNQKRVFTEEV